MTHKLRIELSCVEASLLEAVIQTQMILKAIGAVSQELKVLHDINRQTSSGHSWVTVRIESRAEDIVKIYQLEKQLNPEGH